VNLFCSFPSGNHTFVNPFLFFSQKSGRDSNQNFSISVGERVEVRFPTEKDVFFVEKELFVLCVGIGGSNFIGAIPTSGGDTHLPLSKALFNFILCTSSLDNH
jgi:hypothetical protein